MLDIVKEPIPILECFSEELVSLVKGLLEKDSSLRLGSKEDAEEIKSHPWFKSVDWD